MDKKYLNYSALNDILTVVDMLEKIISTEDLTEERKSNIITVSANNVSKVLKLYELTNKSVIDYSSKKVKFDNIVVDMDEYDTYVKKLMNAYTRLADIQKNTLGEKEYSKRVYALHD